MISTQHTKIIAHRGDTTHHPENTLSAFQAALDHGADAIELDVHMTSDSELIVYHDYYLGNPDNGEGKIYENDLAYVQSLRISEEEKIPMLEEVFEQVGDKLQYEIELKGFGEEFLMKIIALVKKYDLERIIEFTSPHSYNLSRLKVLEPNFKTGMFATPPPDWMDAQLCHTLAINNARLGNIDVLHCPIELIDRGFVQAVRSAGLLVHAADCDTNKDIQAALVAGVDQFSTNKLGLALEVRYSQS